jgi:hypothetical protein
VGTIEARTPPLIEQLPLQTEQEGGLWFSRVDANLFQPILEGDSGKPSVSLNWTWAPVIELDRFIARDEYDRLGWLGLTYRYLDAEGGLVTPVDGVIHVHDELKLQTVDLALYCSKISEKWQLGARYGLRYAHLATGSDDVLAGTSDVQRHRVLFDGGGLYGGYEGYRPLGESGWSVGLGWNYSWLCGPENQKSEWGSSVEGNDVHTRIEFESDVRAGLSWDSSVAGVRLRMTGGYQFEFWTHVGQTSAPQTSVNPAGVGSGMLFDRFDLFFHGPFVRCELRY